MDTEDPSLFRGAFTDDVVVDDWGRTFRGPEAIAGWTDGTSTSIRASA